MQMPAFAEQVDTQPPLRAEIPLLAPIRLHDESPPPMPPHIVPESAPQTSASLAAATLSQAETEPPGTSNSIAADTHDQPMEPLPPGSPSNQPSSPGGKASPPPATPTPAPIVASEPKRRGLPQALDSVFAMTEYVGGPLMGIPDTDPIWPLESIIYKACPLLKKYRIKVYGWVDPSYNASTSKHSNVPLSYNIVPNRLELSQLIGRIERVPDTVQTDHMDWGFRATPLFGIDYRYTVSPGWEPAATSLLKHNDLYSLDYPELYLLWYIPKVKQELMLKLGRYISPPDIEAQLSPDNFLYTHSLMFTYDNYTHTGLQSTVKLNDYWMAQAGIHAGQDNAPWTRSAHPTGEAYLRWVSKSNSDSIYGGVDSVNGGSYKFQKDNLQQFNITWSHRFNERLNFMTEGYYLFTRNALKGGTVSNGPVKGFGGGGGPGEPLPGYSQAYGIVNYTNYKVSNRDYITLRPIDYLFDPRGWRTGFANTMSSWTIGWCHRFSDLLCIRPEVRYERSVGGRQPSPWDNGTKRWQFTFSCDVIQRF